MGYIRAGWRRPSSTRLQSVVPYMKERGRSTASTRAVVPEQHGVVLDGGARQRLAGVKADRRSPGGHLALTPAKSGACSTRTSLTDYVFPSGSGDRPLSFAYAKVIGIWSARYWSPTCGLRTDRRGRCWLVPGSPPYASRRLVLSDSVEGCSDGPAYPGTALRASTPNPSPEAMRSPCPVLSEYWIVPVSGSS